MVFREDSAALRKEVSERENHSSSRTKQEKQEAKGSTDQQADSKKQGNRRVTKWKLKVAEKIQKWGSNEDYKP